MIEENGAAPAAAEPSSVPEVQDTGSDVVSEPTPRGSIDRAFEALDAREKAGAEEGNADRAPNEEGRMRDEHGRFVAAEKPAESAVEKQAEAPDEKAVEAPDASTDEFSEPPARFSVDGKAKWKDAPKEVRAEVHRAVKEMEAGLEKYKAGAEEWEGLREFSELAKTHNTTVKNALTSYVNADRILNQDLVGGLDHVARMYGTSLRDVAAKLMGQTPDQAGAQTDKTISDLRGQIESLKSQLGGVTTSLSQQQQQRAMQEIEVFAKEHPRFEELSEEVARQVNAGFGLPEAYARAERLNPVPPAPAAQAAPKPAATQPRPGSLSISGAPSSGSNPTNKRTPSSAREALDGAFAQLGLG